MKSFRSIPCSKRGQAAAFYLGLLPLFYGLGSRKNDPFLRHHFRQAAAIFALATVLTAAFAGAIVSLSYILVFHRDLYEALRMEIYLLGALRKLYLAWAVFWVFGLAMALLGGMRQMPLVHALGARRMVRRFACAVLIALYAALLILIPLAAHASSLVPPDRQTGTVYMVYEDNGLFPRWLFALGFYRMALAARAAYGPESPVLVKISREAVEEAIAHGAVVVIGSHGTKKGLMLKNDWLLPEEFVNCPKAVGLRLVYLSGCDSGEQRGAWEAAFAPADVVTYDRLSAVLEHAWWFWFRGPEIVRQIATENNHAE